MGYIWLAFSKHYLISHLHLKIEFLYNNHTLARSSFTDDKLARLFSLSHMNMSSTHSIKNSHL
jgi:hypothetical protein